TSHPGSRGKGPRAPDTRHRGRGGAPAGNPRLPVGLDTPTRVAWPAARGPRPDLGPSPRPCESQEREKGKPRCRRARGGAAAAAAATTAGAHRQGDAVVEAIVVGARGHGGGGGSTPRAALQDGGDGPGGAGRDVSQRARESRGAVPRVRHEGQTR